MEQTLEVLSIDMLNGRQFVVYFNDDTVVKISATELAACFPKRSKLKAFDDEASSEAFR